MEKVDGLGELLDGFRAGNRATLAVVYRRYANDLATFLYRGFTFASKGKTIRFSGWTQPYDLDNALQETFIRAFAESARLSYDPSRSYRNYLFAIARNFVID